MIGLIPNSIQVPLDDARYTRTEYNGSDPVGVLIPYSGSYEQTKKMNNAAAVYINLSLKATRLSAGCTSGSMARNGLTRFKAMIKSTSINCDWMGGVPLVSQRSAPQPNTPPKPNKPGLARILQQD